MNLNHDIIRYGIPHCCNQCAMTYGCHFVCHNKPNPMCSKFIYSDCWGSIILRNEAWIKLENLIPLCKYREMNYSQIASDVLSRQKYSIKGMSNEVCLEWERYWRNVVKYVCEYIGFKR